MGTGKFFILLLTSTGNAETSNKYVSGTVINTINTWIHLAVTQQNGILRIFQDGLLTGTNSTQTNFPIWNSTQPIKIGASDSSIPPDLYFPGYISDLRITKGVARYTDDFTPPASIPEISPRGPRLYDQILGDIYSPGTQGPNLEHTSGPFGGPALYFNGSSYLTCPFSRYFDILDQSSGFTLEMWFKIDRNGALNNSNTRDMALIAFSFPDSGTVTNGLSFFIPGTSTDSGVALGIELASNGQNISICESKILINKGEWHHFVACKESSNGLLSFYLDGKKLILPNPYINNTVVNFTNSMVVKIGTNNYTGYLRHFIGWMADIRLTKECRYFEDFSPPTVTHQSGDPYLSDVSLLMHFNETAKDPRFGLLSDIKGNSITASGNVSLSSGGKFGQTCAYFNSSVDYLTIPNSTNFAFGSGDFTIEAWVYPFNPPVAGSPAYLWDQLIFGSTNYTPDLAFFLTNNTLQLALWDQTTQHTTAIKVKPNEWTHIAACRSGTTIKLFINGVVDYSGACSKSFSLGGIVYIGGGGFSVEGYFKGLMNDLRITKGIARYTANFTPPTGPLPTNFSDPYWSNVALLMPFKEMNQFLDVMKAPFTPIGDVSISSTQSKFDGLSARFNGTGFLTSPHRDAFNFLGDFTIEGWIFPESVTGTQIIIRKPDNTSSFPNPAYELRLNGTNIQFTAYNTQAIFLNETFGTVSLNTWHHFAICKMGDLWKLFLDGTAGLTKQTSVNSAFSNQTTLPLVIGGDSVNRLYGFNGYLDELRFTKNVARYTGNFTPPTSPFKDTGDGDSLSDFYPGCHLRFNTLTVKNNLFDEKGNVLTAFGNVALSTTQSKFNGSSAVFDGTGDYLTFPHSSALDLSTGDFTVECWFYLPSPGTGYYTLFTKTKAGSNGNATVRLNIFNQNFYCYSRKMDDSDWEISFAPSTTVSINTWHHVAYVRNGSQFDLYYDGTSIANGTSSANLLSHTDPWVIGYLENSGSEKWYMNGYINDLRITKGVARYTTTFTPSTESLPNEIDPYWTETVFLAHFRRNLRGIYDDRGHSLTLNGPVTLSTSQSKWGGVSGYFPGIANSCVTSAASTDFGMGTGDFTIEGWFYLLGGLGTDRGLVDFRATIPAANNGTFFIDSATDKLAFWDGTTKFGSSGTALLLNTWYHICLVRLSGTMTCYLNGSQDFQATVSTDLGSSKPLGIGGSAATGSVGDSPFIGYMDDLRITKGVARYTGAFTPPSGPLPAYSGNSTSEYELFHFPLTGIGGNTTSFIDLGPNQFSLTPTDMSYPDNQTTSILRHPKSGFPAYFNGSSSKLTLTTKGGVSFNKDWTLECWLYPTVSGTNRVICSFDGINGSHASHYFRLSSANKIEGHFAKDSNPGTVMTLTSSASISANVWTHIKFYKTGLFVGLLINGVYDSGVLLDEQPEPANNVNSFIGCYYYYYSGTNFFAGYIEDLIMTSCYSPPKRSANLGYQSQFNLTQLPLLKCSFDGTDDSTIFTDSVSGQSLGVNGSAVLSTDDKKFGASSAYFTGGSDYLTVPILGLFDYSEKDFGIDCWIKTTEIAGNEQVIFKQIDSASDRQVVIQFGGASDSHKLIVIMGDPITDRLVTSLTKTDFSTAFKHLQVQKKPFGFKVFVDGTCVGYQPINTNAYQSMCYDVTLLHMNGANNSTTFTDSCITPRTWTANGNVKISTDQSVFGGASAVFDGTGDYLQTASSSVFCFGTDNFTIECWINIQADSVPDQGGNRDAVILNSAPTGIKFHLLGDATTTGTGLYLWEDTRDVILADCIFAQPLSKNTWTHIACSRDKNRIFRFFLNGVLQSETYDSGNAGSGSSTTQIGGDPNTANYNRYFNGYIDELRVTRGIARYIENFTVPSQPLKGSTEENYFLSTPSSVMIGGDGTNGFKGYLDELQIYQGDYPNRSFTVPTQSIPNASFDLIDNAINPMMVTNKNVTISNIINYGSQPAVIGSSKAFYFDGTSQLLIKKSSDEWLTSENFTLEFWMYRLDVNVVRTIFSSRSGAGVYSPFVLDAQSNGTVRLSTSITGTSWITLETPVQTVNTWYHIAVCRYDDVISIYQNGDLSASSNLGESPLLMSLWQSPYFQLGGDDQGNKFWGYIKEFQFIRGYAKYQSGFLPSSNPLSFFNIDYFLKPLMTFSPSLISHYKLNDTGTELIDSVKGFNLDLISPENMTLGVASITPYNVNIDDCITFNGGYGSGDSLSVLDKKTISFNFFIKTTDVNGDILKKSGSYLIDLSNGKIRATFTVIGGSAYSVTSQTSVNDNTTRQITVNFKTNIIEILINGVLDALYNTGIINVINKYTENSFNGETSATILQLRCNDLTDDCKNNVYNYGSEPTFINDSPFGTTSLYFNGSNHLEIPNVHLSRQQIGTSIYYPCVIDFTIEFWVKTFQLATSNVNLISFGASGSSTGTASHRGGLAIFLDSNQRIRIEAGNVSQDGAIALYYKKTVTPLPVLTWTHVAITCKNHFIRVYLNGQEDPLEFENYGTYPTNTLSNSTVFSPNPLNIGGWNWNNGNVASGSTSCFRANRVAMDDIRITRGVIYG